MAVVYVKPNNCQLIRPIDLFLDSDSFIITYHIALVSVQTNYCNNNLSILDVKQIKSQNFVS